MAREQRRDVDYFPHDCTHGRKMHIIESKYGNDGYATWFKLLEQLGKANNHYIDINDESTIMYLASVCKINEDILVNILNDLSKLGAIDKNLYENFGVIWSQKFVDSVADAYRKRKTETPQYSAVLEQYSGKNGSIRVGNPSIRAGMAEVIPKEKKSIVEYSREEKRKEKNILLKKEPKKNISVFNFKKALIDYGFREDLVDDWLKVRKTKKATNTKTAFNAFINEIESRSCNIDEMLQIAVTNSWSGFKHKWVDNLKTTSNGTQQPKSVTEIAAAAYHSEAARNFRFK